MNNYEKPMVMVNEELAEGVYAASGSDCWSISVYTTSNVTETSREVHIDGSHTNPGHHNAYPSVTITFDQTITGVPSTSGLDCSYSGNSVTVSRNFWTSNGTENWGVNITVSCASPSTLGVVDYHWSCPN